MSRRAEHGWSGWRYGAVALAGALGMYAADRCALSRGGDAPGAPTNSSVSDAPTRTPSAIRRRGRSGPCVAPAPIVSDSRAQDATAEVAAIQTRVTDLEAELARAKSEARRKLRYDECFRSIAAVVGPLDAYPAFEVQATFARVYAVLRRDRSAEDYRSLLAALDRGFEVTRRLQERARSQRLNDDGELETLYDPQAAGITGEDWRAANVAAYEAIKDLLDGDERPAVRSELVGEPGADR